MNQFDKRGSPMGFTSLLVPRLGLAASGVRVLSARREPSTVPLRAAQRAARCRLGGLSGRRRTQSVRRVVYARDLSSGADTGSSAPLRTPLTEKTGPPTLSGMALSELERLVTTLGEKPYRARQLYRWLYRLPLATQLDQMSDIGKRLREALAQNTRLHALRLSETREARDGTRKLVYRVEDGNGAVESVLIPAPGRNTLCISSQLGCAMNCQFCFTGKMGLRRNLVAAEIVDQVSLTRNLYETPHDARSHISNIVFMGMGEPFQNLDNVLKVVEILLDPKGMGFSHNKVTVSTSGLVPEIRRYLRESRANLAVSLNATTDQVRNWIMPINRKYPLEELVETLREEYARDTRRGEKVFFEYVLLGDINDSLEDAKRLLRITARVPCKVNLIPFNSHVGSEFRPSPLERMEAFRRYLHERGVLVTLRRSRGDDQMAACGQLGSPGFESTPPRMRVPEAFQHLVQRRPADTTA